MERGFRDAYRKKYERNDRMSYIQKKRMLNKICLSIVIFFSLSYESVAVTCYICLPQSCDMALKYAMDTKQKTSLEARLDDFIGAINANTNQTKNQTKIIEQEILAYRRLRNRIKKEGLMLQEASHISKQIKDNGALGIQIYNIQKGKQ